MIENQGAALLRTAAYAHRLLSNSPGCVRNYGTATLGGRTAADFVHDAVGLLVSGQRKVYTIQAALYGTTLMLVQEAARDASEHRLLEETDMRLLGSAQSAAQNRRWSLPHLLAKKPELLEVTYGRLLGQSASEMAANLGLPLRVVERRIRIVESVARRAQERFLVPI
jgi:hypothetical protein